MEITRTTKVNIIEMIKGLLKDGTFMHDAVDFATRFWSCHSSYCCSGDHAHSIFHISDTELFVKVTHESKDVEIYETGEI